MNERAKIFRQNMTVAERKIWYFLRGRWLIGYKFVREHIVGKYIVDFACREKKVIIELDGSQHTDAIDYDEKRTHFLEEQGYQVIRFWNNDVLANTNDVLETILNVLETVQR